MFLKSWEKVLFATVFLSSYSSQYARGNEDAHFCSVLFFSAFRSLGVGFYPLSSSYLFVFSGYQAGTVGTSVMNLTLKMAVNKKKKIWMQSLHPSE